MDLHGRTTGCERAFDGRLLKGDVVIASPDGVESQIAGGGIVDAKTLSIGLFYQRHTAAPEPEGSITL